MRRRYGRLVAAATAVCLIALLAVPMIAGAGEVDAQQVITIYPDAYESDDTSATAKMLPNASYHTISSYTDTDWMKFSVAATGTPYIFETQMYGGNEDCDLYMYLYQLNPDGTLTTLDSSDDHGYWESYSEYIVWEAPAPGTYFLEVCGISEGETGNYMLYWDDGYARRIAGADRYKTAVEVSKVMNQMHDIYLSWDFYTEGVVITSGLNPADALAGGVLAAAVDGPMLLSGAMGLSAETRAEIGRVIRPEIYYQNDPMTIYILGSTAAVPSAVEAQLRAIPEVAAGIKDEVLEIVRVGGDNRYETAAMVAAEIDDIYGLGSRAYIVGGTAWADGIAVSPPAIYNESPILLTAQSALSEDAVSAIDDLGITEAIIIGGPTVVSAAVETALDAKLGVGNVRRIAGDNRYETAMLVAMHAVDDVWMDGDSCILASGANWPDALVAGPMSYSLNGGYGTSTPILLTRPDMLSGEVVSFFTEYGQPTDLCYVVGGTPAVSAATLNAFNAMRIAD